MDTNNAIVFLNDIQASFKKMKVITIAACVACAAVAVGSVAVALSFSEAQRDQVYVLDDGSVLMAQRTENMAQRDLEAVAHLTRFHELFYNVAPNTETIKSNIDAAIAMGDESVYKNYNNLKERQFFSTLIQINAIQQVVVDSVKVDMNSKPYRATTYLTRYYVRPSNVTKYSMITTCTLSEVPRSRTNPHGLFIGNFVLRTNDEIETRKRK